MAAAMLASLVVVLVLGLWIPGPLEPAAAQRRGRDRRADVIALERAALRRRRRSPPSSKRSAGG